MKRGKYKVKEHIKYAQRSEKSRTKRHSLDAQWRGLTNTEKQEVLDIYYGLAEKLN